MASAGVLPTRHRRDESIKRQKSKSELEILLQMGFSKQRAEKAIAATGDRGVQLASDWLLSHVNDQKLDENNTREYILYLCPQGALQKQVSDFAEKSLNTCGWNGSHAYFPHVTLCPFFTVEDSKVHKATAAILKLESKLCQAPGRMKLDFFSQINFIGLFVQEDYYKYLSELTNQMSEHLKSEGIKFETHKKQLHMTMAYQYQADKHEKLLEMAKDIDLNTDVHWDFRLYSRDVSKGQCEVRKVIKAYTTQLGDELELIDGDFVYVDPKEVQDSKDDWYNGTSWLTGSTGYFPGTYTQRTAETRTWTLHRSLPMEARAELPPVTPPPTSHPPPTPHINGTLEDDTYDNLWHDTHGYAMVRKKPVFTEPERRVPRKLYVVRHGERVDFAMGKEWFDMCFDETGKYQRTNMNLPKDVLKRNTHLEYIHDPPLSEIGRYQARTTGESLFENGVTVFCIYCSPSVRCVMTATEILKVFKLPWKLRIEPGLYEWTGYAAGVPRWLSPVDLEVQGYPVDTTYIPQYPHDKLVQDETVQVLYARSTETTKQILKNHELEGGNLMFVGHTGTLELCTRQLLGKGVRTLNEYKLILPKVPYCGVCVVEEDPAKKKWAFLESPVFPFTHGRNTGQNILSVLQA